MRAHILPHTTYCAFNKSGDRFITGSYDRTCKVWNTVTGEELLPLEGQNVVYAIAFKNSFGDKLVTGSFDNTEKMWDSETGELLNSLRGRATDIACLSFAPHGLVDSLAKLWDVSRGVDLLCSLTCTHSLGTVEPFLLAICGPAMHHWVHRPHVQHLECRHGSECGKCPHPPGATTTTFTMSHSTHKGATFLLLRLMVRRVCTTLTLAGACQLY